jgi:hypothetical protein
VAMKFGNGIDVANQKVVNLADPSANTDAANKQYVDAVARGLSWKQAVKAASTANVTVASAPATLDGITLTAADRVLLKDQSTGAENGIYRYVSTGAALVRVNDLQAGDDGRGIAVTVENGTVNNDRVYIQTNDPAVVDTNALAFSQLGGGGTAYAAGSGLTESPAGTFNVGAGTGITVNADDVALAATVAGNGLTHSAGVLNVVGDASITVAADSLGLAAGVAGAGLTLSTGVLAVGAGSGISVAADAVAVDSSVARVYAANIGDGSTTNIVVTHNLGTRDIVVAVRSASTPWEQVIVDNEATSTTTCTLKFAVAPTTNQYRVIVTGVGA